MTREIVFDSETTGLDPKFHRMVSFAGVELVDRLPTGRFLHFYLNPDRESDPRALEVHGLTTEFLSDKPRFSQVAVDLVDFIDDDPLVIHNAVFDRGFLDTELIRMGLGKHVGRSVCTKCLAQKQRGYGGGGTGANYRPSNRLDDLVRAFNIRDLRLETGAHGALVDCLLLVNVYRSLLGLPVVDFDLSPYMEVVNGRASERSSESPNADQTTRSADLGAGAGASGSGAGQELRGNAGVPDAAAPGRAESAGTTTGGSPLRGEGRAVTGVAP